MTDTTAAESVTGDITLPTPNLPLLRKVLDHIDAHPDEWNQSMWATETECGTAYCVAGHAVAMTEGVIFDEFGYGPAESLCWTDGAQKALGVTDDEGLSLFYAGNTRADVQRAAERIAAADDAAAARPADPEA